MRLVCPNCAAQYEIDASAFPDEGTEVQCSACSTVWFQPGPDSALPTSDTARKQLDSDPVPEPEDAGAEVPETTPAVPPSGSSQPPVALPPEADAPSIPPPQGAAQRALDPAVATVLREEAEFEAKQRAREKNPLETQEELGLFGPVSAAADPADARSGASSLPDIDDISSTLEPIATVRAGQSELPQTETERKRRFLSGLGVPLVLALFLTALYLLAPVLAAVVPALESPLGTYVALVQNARLAVAGILGTAP